MYALFKNGEQVSDAYDTPGDIPVQTECVVGKGKFSWRLLWPRSMFRLNTDGYEVRWID